MKKEPRAPRAKAKPKAAPEVPEAEVPTPEDPGPDLDTVLLEYLVNRRQSQQDRRRQLWSHLAGL